MPFLYNGLSVFLAAKFVLQQSKTNKFHIAFRLVMQAGGSSYFTQMKILPFKSILADKGKATRKKQNWH